MSIDQIVLNYQKFLLMSWSCLSEILAELDWDEFPYFLDEWMQANWELLVEQQADPSYTLASYGFDGSPQCRYSEKDRIVTHRVICWEKEKIPEIKHVFLCFVGKIDGTYKISPPFDYVDVENAETRERATLPLDEISFALEEI
jgi:hypothetical protein